MKSSESDLKQGPVHTRYVVQHQKKPELFQAHRSSGWDTFEHARVWSRQSDARHATFHGPWKKPIANAVVVPVTVALGQPYAVFAEAP